MLVKIFNKGYLIKILDSKKELDNLNKDYEGYEFKIINDDGTVEWGVITNAKAYEDKKIILELSDNKTKKESNGDGKKKISD